MGQLAASSILAEPYIADLIRRFFRFGGDLKVSFHQAMMHDTYAVSVGRDGYFLKVHREGHRTLDQLEAEADALVRLRAARSSVAKPAATGCCF